MAQKIITFANHKGGVSKTTSTASIGACMAMKGKKVLLVDLDGQANLTLYFIPNEDEIEMSIFDSLVNGVPLPVKHIRENLAIVPSSLEMASAEIALTNLLARERLLSNLLEPFRKDYDHRTDDTGAPSVERHEDAGRICHHLATGQAVASPGRCVHRQIQSSQTEQSCGTGCKGTLRKYHHEYPHS